MNQKFLAEFFGTAFLLIIVVGSGIMGESLAQGNGAIALLATSLATGAGLYAIIQTFGHISGAHFNPAVSFVEWLWKRLSTSELIYYTSAQITGAVVGVILTHLIFGQKLIQLSAHDRGDFHFFISEVIATFGLITVIALSGRRRVETTPFEVAAFITSTYWCTSSTSFANPAVTIARCFTDTFSGILWTGAPGFILAQGVGALFGFWISNTLSDRKALNARTK